LIEKNRVLENDEGEKGVQKILLFSPYSSIKSVIAAIMKCVRVLNFIPSTLASISFTKAVGNRIVTFCVPVFPIFTKQEMLRLNINTCNAIYFNALRFNANWSGAEWKGKTF